MQPRTATRFTSPREPRWLEFGFIAVLALTLALQTVAVAQFTAPMLAAGLSHSLTLLPDGTVKAWGANNLGQSGLQYWATTPTQIPTNWLINAIAVSGGGWHSLALLSNGTVKAWGDDSWGQTGAGPGNMSVPLPISSSSLSGVVAIAAGLGHSLALLQNGTVKSWGRNHMGQLGLGYTTSNFWGVPPAQQIPPSSLSNVTAIAAGWNHSLALLSNGTVMAWGDNNAGQLGIGIPAPTYMATTPVQIPASSLSNVVAIAAGLSHSLALLANGTVMAWGGNGYGELGTGSTTAAWYGSTPVQIPASSLNNVVAIAAGSGLSLALLSNGTVKAWGRNEYGQLGLGHTVAQSTPQQIPAGSLSNVTAIAAGAGFTLAQLSNGAVKSWGDNSYGQLGLGYVTANGGLMAPQPVQGLCVSVATAYAMLFGALTSATLDMLIPCNPATGALSGQHYYFNAFSANPLNATSPGTGAWHGLHTTQAEVLSWLNWGTSGFTLALGPLASTGGAMASVAIPAGSLSGLTIYGVSVAFNASTLAVVASSLVTSTTF